MSWLRGMILGVFAAALLAFGLGFWGFAQSVNSAAPPTPFPEADGIVALTGGSLARLNAGMDLLAQGYGRRLLISGVNPQVKDEEIAKLLHGGDQLFKCCVDIGRRAEDTIGNAAEAAAWSKRNGYETVIIVTDNYHMPRALSELRVAMPRIKLVPYPVRARISRDGVWQNDPGAAARLASEYVKYLVVRVRETLASLDRAKPEPAPA
jgi:uncharacterized SAM-binding protein YcdF (DUF218 family)